MFEVPRKWTTALLGGVAGIVVGLAGIGAMFGVAWGGRVTFPYATGAGLFYGLVGVITAAILRRRLLRAPLDSHPVAFCLCLGAVYAPVVAGALVLIAWVPGGAWIWWRGRLSGLEAGWVLGPIGGILLAEPLALGCGAALGVWLGLRTRPWRRGQGEWVARTL